MVSRSRLIETIALDRVRRGVRETPRDRVLTDDELRVLLEFYRGHKRLRLWRLAPDALAYRHASERRASLQARDLDFEARTIAIRAEVSKTRQTRTIPMPDSIVDTLRARSRGLGPTGYLFGEASGFGRPFSASRSRSRSCGRPCRREWVDGPCMTCAARARPECISREFDALVIEDVLGHLTGVRGGVAGIYNSAKTIDRQRQALAGWSKTLQKLLAVAPTE